jgi:hypothetical protein
VAPPVKRLARPPPRKPTVSKKSAAKAVALRKAVKGKVAGRSRAKQPSLLRQLSMGIAVIALLIAALPSAVLLCFGLMPTMCGFLIDRTPPRYATRCVGALNFAGCWPYLLNLWKDGHNMVNAVHILLDPTAWLVIYGSAAAGWLCYLSFPAVAWALMDVFAGRRIAHLRKEQRKLIGDWGDEVAKAPIQPLI